MKILFVLPDITTRGGVERITSILANTFVRKGIDVTIISLFKRMDRPAFALDEKVCLTFITENDYNLKEGRVRLLPILWKAYTGLKKFLKAKPHDLIIAQCFLPALLVFFSGYARQSVVCEHFKYELYKQPILALRNYVYKKFRRVITLTQTDADKYSLVLKQVRVIPNISPFIVSDFSDLSQKRIIAVGRLHHQKGFDLLLDAVKDLFQTFRDWRLDVYGEGELYNKLIEQRDLYHLQSFVDFKGYTDNIKNEMLQSSIFVLSSRYEGLPLVLLEAMSCALPIVSFKCPEGPADLLKDNIGYLVEAENVVALRNALKTMMENQLLREIYANREKIAIKKYSTDSILKIWIDLFYELGYSV